jgi:hypothetical protein
MSRNQYSTPFPGPTPVGMMRVSADIPYRARHPDGDPARRPRRLLTASCASLAVPRCPPTLWHCCAHDLVTDSLLRLRHHRGAAMKPRERRPLGGTSSTDV